MVMHHHTKFDRSETLSGQTSTEVQGRTFTVTLTLNTAKQPFYKTLQLMNMYGQTKLATKKISSSEHIIEIVMIPLDESKLSYYLDLNSFIPVSYLALLPLIPMFLYAQQSFHSWVFIRKKSVKEGMWVWVICVCKLLVKPWQPIYRCVGKWSQKTMVTLSESLSPGGWHTGANKGDTYPF